MAFEFIKKQSTASTSVRRGAFDNAFAGYGDFTRARDCADGGDAPYYYDEDTEYNHFLAEDRQLTEGTPEQIATAKYLLSVRREGPWMFHLHFGDTPLLQRSQYMTKAATMKGGTPSALTPLDYDKLRLDTKGKHKRSDTHIELCNELIATLNESEVALTDTNTAVGDAWYRNCCQHSDEQLTASLMGQHWHELNQTLGLDTQSGFNFKFVATIPDVHLATALDGTTNLVKFDGQAHGAVSLVHAINSFKGEFGEGAAKAKPKAKSTPEVSEQLPF